MLFVLKAENEDGDVLLYFLTCEIMLVIKAVHVLCFSWRRGTSYKSLVTGVCLGRGKSMAASCLEINDNL